MQLSGIRQKVFLDRYSLKDKQGNPLEIAPEQMWRRVAKAVSSIEGRNKRKKWQDQYYWAMKDYKYVPGGRILAGAGSGYSVTYYNCFVIPSPKDSRGGILESLGQMVEIMAHGGGVGINLSSLRPKGSRVKKVNGFSSGPCNWAELFSLATKDIIQQGGTRRGALMLMLHDWHPDIEEFITVKQDLTRINGANLSVAISDAFIEAVKKDLDWYLCFPDRSDPEYDLKWDGDLEIWRKMGKKVNVKKVVKARAIWDLIAKAAWNSAEPGVVFMERYNKLHNNYYWNRINCVNPCGEEGLPPFGVCNLGSINLSAFVSQKDIDKPGKFDFDLLRKVTRIAVRFQDNIVDMDPYVFDGIKKIQLEGERRIGLGTMGLGDALIKMHLRYGSPESISMIEKIYKIIRDEAYNVSTQLAKEKGSFAKFDRDKYSKGLFVSQLPAKTKQEIKKYGIRNSLLLMQAPTGTTSLLAGTTSGIEPVYEFEYIRHSRLGKDLIRHHLYDAWYRKHQQEAKTGTVKKPGWFVGANDLTPEEHVVVQAAIQKYVDASISKTVNAPSSHSIEDVKNLYMLAYDYGCKGLTYMREGSRQGVLERKEEKKEKEELQEKKQPPVLPRPYVVSGATYKMRTPVGNAYITINSAENDEPLEVFINVGKTGSDVGAMAEGLGRMISLILRVSSHLSPKDRIQNIVDHLINIGGGRSVGFGKNRALSLPDAVAKVLVRHFNLKTEIQPLFLNGSTNGSTSAKANGQATDQEKLPPKTDIKEPIEQLYSQAEVSFIELIKNNHFDICPSCGVASLVYEEGCKKCYNCAYSAC